MRFFNLGLTILLTTASCQQIGQPSLSINKDIAYISPNGTTPKPTRSRIVGGVETKRNEYPFIVSIWRGFLPNGHFCGGSIIDRQWVITAAHCVTKPDFKLNAGDHDLRTTEGSEQTVYAEKVIRHPDYHPITFENDIALVKVTPPFNLTRNVRIFQIPSSHFVATGDVVTAGWGVTEEGSTQVSPVLRKVTIEILENIECSKMYGRDFHLEKMLCAADEGKDACQGDSGGPLLCSDDRFGDTLCGIVSYGFGCARPEFAGVYTKVAHYYNWITSEISSETPKAMPTTTTTTTTPAPSTRVPIYYRPRDEIQDGHDKEHGHGQKPPRRGRWGKGGSPSSVVNSAISFLSLILSSLLLLF